MQKTALYVWLLFMEKVPISHEQLFEDENFY